MARGRDKIVLAHGTSRLRTGTLARLVAASVALASVGLTTPSHAAALTGGTQRVMEPRGTAAQRPAVGARQRGLPAASAYGPAVHQVLAAQSSITSVDTEDRDSVIDAALTLARAADTLPAYTTAEPQTCEVGMRFLTSETASTVVNFARTLAGVPALEYVEEDLDDLTRVAMRDSDPRPAPDPNEQNPCYTPELDAFEDTAYQAPRDAADAIFEILDPYGEPTALTRWALLLPTYDQMSTGDVAPLRGTDRRRHALALRDNVPNSGLRDLVPWPSAGYFPSLFAPDLSGLWGLRSSQSDVRNVSVSVTVDGQPVQAQVVSRARTFMTFQFPGSDESTEKTVDVEIAGITGGAQSTVSYTTRIVNPAQVEEAWQGPDLEGQTFVGGTLTYTPHAEGLTAAAAKTLVHDVYREGQVSPVATFSGPGPFTYNPTDADVGSALVFVSSAVDAQGRPVVLWDDTEPITAADQVPVNTRAPQVLGRAQVGRILEADPGEWDGGSVGDDASYQWLRDGEDIAGATGRVYRAQAADVGSRLSVRVTMSSDLYPTTSAVSDPSEPAEVGAEPKVAGNPKIVGDLRPGGKVELLTLRWKNKPGLPQPDQVRYQWFSGGVPVQGATSRIYRVRRSDAGAKLLVSVQAVTDGYETANLQFIVSDRVPR